MVFFVLTRNGYEKIRMFLDQPSVVLWVNKDVLTPAELSSLRRSGFNVTNFAKPVALVRQDIDEALATIAEHHPNTSIWIEAKWPI